MPYIKVDVNKINQYTGTVDGVRSQVQRIMAEVASIGLALDWDIKASSSVNAKIMSAVAELNAEASSLSKMNSFLNTASMRYTATDMEIGECAKRLAETIGAASYIGTSIVSSRLSKVGAAVATASVGVKMPDMIVLENPLEYFDIKGMLNGLKDGGLTAYKLWQNGFWSSNFNIKQVGDYVRVYGKNKTWRVDGSTLEHIKGRRYRIGSEKDVKFGVSARATNIPLTTKFSRALKWNFNGFFKDTFASKSAIMDYLSIGYDTVKNIVGNVKSGSSISKIGADIVTDVGTGLGGMAVTSAGVKFGAAVGTLIPIPVIGTLAGGIIGGAVAGFAYEYIIDGIKIGGKSIAGWTSYALEGAGDLIVSGVSAVGDAVVGAGKAVGEFAQSAGKAIGGAVDAVGDAISGFANGAKNFFGKIF